MTNPTLVQILDVPVAAPGTCISCGSPGDDKRKFIDFNLIIDYFGVVYFCTFCFNEIANACDFVDNTKYLELLQQNRELREALDIANGRVSTLDATYRNYFANSNSVDTLRDVSDRDEISRSFEGIAPSAGKSTEDNDKSSDIEKSGDVHSTPDIIESVGIKPKSNPLEF